MTQPSLFGQEEQWAVGVNSGAGIEVHVANRNTGIIPCKQFHYAGRLPMTTKVVHSVYEDSEFIGVIIYGNTSGRANYKKFGVEKPEIMELLRIALRGHDAFLTQIMSKSIKLYKQHNPNVKILLSYADIAQGHIGIIYQAMSWVYLGALQGHPVYNIKGELGVHDRTVRMRHGRTDMAFLRTYIDPNVEAVPTPPKHLYVFGLNKTWKKKLTAMHQPYPKDET